MKRAAFWAYFALAVAWLGFGLATIAIPMSPTLRASLRPSDQPLVWRMLAAPDPVTDKLATVLDYTFSLVTLVLAVVLHRLRKRSPAAGLLAVALVGTAVAYNLTGHRVLDAVTSVVGEDVLELPHLLLFHAVAGVAYVNALILFPSAQPGRPRRWFSGGALANVALVVVAAETGLYHTGLFLLFYGLLTPIVALVAQTVRARRATDPAQRRQSRTVQAALVIAIASAVAASAVVYALTDRNADDPLAIAFGVFRMVFLLIPIALIVALLRLRLWDADRLVNRAIVYAILVGLISLGYAGFVLAAAPWLYVGIAAAAIGPLRNATQRLANRLVYGARPHALQLLGELRAPLDNVLDLPEVLPGLAAAVGRQLRATSCAITVFGPGDLTGAWSNATAPGPRRRLVINHMSTPIGELVVGHAAGEPSRTDRRLAHDAAGRLGPTLHQLRLRRDLDEQLQRSDDADRLLRESCRQIVAASDAERRRLERNIHDGAQQTLIAVGVQPNGGADVVRQAIEDVRALARGLHPAALTDTGLAAALGALPAPPGRRIRVVAPDRRFRAELETGIYYACVEAIQNASRHGRSDIDVKVWIGDGRLNFTVRDEGPAVAGGNRSGTESIRARLTDLHGEATVDHSEHGTIVSGWAPVC